jgi:hypothetical protein
MSDTKANEIFKSMVGIATEGLKALLLVNGGAVVALLTFVGNSETVAAGQFAVPAAAFLTGLVLCVIAFCSAYATQFHLYNEQPPEPKFPARSHMRFFKWTALFVATSLIAFSVGAMTSVNALSTVETPNKPKLEQPQPQISCNCNCAPSAGKKP